MLTDADLDKVARIARLRLTEEERRTLLRDLESILAMVEEMREADVSKAPSMAHIFDRSQRMREDKASREIDRKALLENAPGQEDNLFVVPRVIE